MKKNQRNFVVEYKSGRRKSQNGPTNSIWGNLDLKSVARDVDTVFTDASNSVQAPGESRTQAQDRLTVEASGRHNEIAAAADRRDVFSDAASEVETDPQKSGLVDAISGAVLPETSAEQLDRTDIAVLQPKPESCSVQRTTRAPKMPRRKMRQLEKTGNRTSGSLAPAEAISAALSPNEFDELADLEAENRRLKQLLATKLQKENVWLREQLRRAR
ncbi:hypothetical protein [Rhizobium sp.]|uniref:hypothetical protein n=1 Tax=Rhizobium sp. TaxID=391 RepID=UPI0028B0FEA8